MLWARRFWLKLRSLFRHDRNAQRLDDEIQFHLDQQIAENLSAGMSREEARYAAMRAFGNPTFLKEETRDTWGWTWLEQIAQDLRFGLRALRRKPGFSILVILALALGIGVNTTVFTALDATAFRPLPVEEPDLIVRVIRWIPQGYGGTLFSLPEYVYYRDHNDVFLGLAADSCCYNVVYGGQPAANAVTMHQSALLTARLVSENYFEVLGINAVLGRTFLPEEGQSEKSNPVAVLSYQFWQQRVNSDPNILGKSLILNATHFTVVGIAPRDFIGSGDPPAVPDVWIPLAMQRYIVPGSQWMNNTNTYNVRMVGQLQPGTALKRAQPVLTVLAPQLAHTPIAKDQTASTTHLTVKRASFLDFGGTGAEFAVSVTLALAAAGMVLLVACASRRRGAIPRYVVSSVRS